VLTTFWRQETTTGACLTYTVHNFGIEIKKPPNLRWEAFTSKFFFVLSLYLSNPAFGDAATTSTAGDEDLAYTFHGVKVNDVF
jgi:hypothetical protein